MTVKSGTAWAGSFVTLDATGALSASADAAGTLYVDGTANAAAVTITGSNPYKWAVTLPTLTAGQRVDMYITGTIATIATAGFVASEQADTSLLSDGVAVASIATDAITADSLKADAVSEIQSGLATSANLQTVDDNVDAIKAKTDNLPADPAAVGSAMTLTAAYDKAKDDVLTPLGVVDGIVDAIKVQTDKIPATPASAGEYTANIGAIKAKTDNLPLSPASSGEYTSALTAIQNDLDNPDQYKADVSTLATTAHVQEVEDKVDIVDGIADAIKAKTDQLTFTVANKVDATAPADTSSIAGDVWSYAKRTLTHPSVSAEEPEDSNTLILYRDADIAIELTDLTIPAGAKKYIFTIKDNLDSGDDQAVLQASYAIDGSEVETNTLVYINSAEAPALTNPVTFTLTETNITIDLTAEAAALLPRYERGYLNWDLKLVTDAAVTIVLQGLAQIIGTSTRAIE